MTAAAAVYAQTRTAVAGAVHDARARWGRAETLGAVVVGLAALLPVLPLDVGLSRLASDLYLGAAAVGLGIIVGLGGMPSLGHGALLAVGAFGAALVDTKLGWPMEAALAVGVLAAAAAGGAVGVVAVRLRPALVAVVTWLIAWLVALGLVAFPSVSGGAQGIVLGDDLSPTVLYELGVAFAAVSVLLFVVLARSPAGIALSAAREHRAAAESVGAPITRLRAGTFALGGGIAGLAGGLGVYAAGVADAASYGPLLSAKLFIAVVLGGAVAAAGGLVGIAVLVGLGRVVELGGLESLQAARVETLLVAAIVVAAVGTVDKGILPSLAERRRRRSAIVARPAPLGSFAGAPLEARGLTKRFGSVTALDDVDLDIAEATVHALIGPNGSGKTTALRVLSGSVEPDAGSVVFAGDELREVGPDRGIVATLQATAVFSELTALENAMVGASLRLRHGGLARAVLATPKARADAHAARSAALGALELVGLGEVAGVRAGELAGAAQRRLMIATALATRPRVLLLDEPSAGADRSEVERLAELLGTLRARGLTIVLVEHNLRLVRRVADQVTVLATGRVIARGRVEQVIEDEAVHRAYLGRGRF